MHVCVTEIVIMFGEAVLPGHGSGPHLIVELINLPCSAQICPTCPPPPPSSSGPWSTNSYWEAFFVLFVVSVTHPTINNKC